MTKSFLLWYIYLYITNNWLQYTKVCQIIYLHIKYMWENVERKYPPAHRGRSIFEKPFVLFPFNSNWNTKRTGSNWLSDEPALAQLTSFDWAVTENVQRCQIRTKFHTFVWNVLEIHFDCMCAHTYTQTQPQSHLAINLSMSTAFLFIFIYNNYIRKYKICTCRHIERDFSSQVLTLAIANDFYFYCLTAQSIWKHIEMTLKW